MEYLAIIIGQYHLGHEHESQDIGQCEDGVEFINYKNCAVVFKKKMNEGPYKDQYLLRVKLFNIVAGKFSEVSKNGFPEIPAV